MADGLIAAHSGLRWLVVAAVVTTAVWAFGRGREAIPGWVDGVQWLVRAQLVLGLVLYGVNAGHTQGLFLALWHPVGMLAALGVLEAGVVRARREDSPRTLGVFALASLVLMLAAIPWFRGLI